MYAFEVGGYPTVQGIGSDPTNLTWIVDHLPGTFSQVVFEMSESELVFVGTTLMLSVLDSNNNTGGVDTTFYYVTGMSYLSTVSTLTVSNP